MTKNLSIWKGLFLASVLGLAGVCLNGCSENDLVVAPTIQDDNVSTGTRGSEFHWRCPEIGCGLLNAGWRDSCARSGCKGKHSEEHGRLILTFKDVLEKTAGEGGKVPNFEWMGEDIPESSVANRIVLPGGYLADFAPASWFDAYKAQTYYNNLKTLGYYSDPAYAEGVDVGWYRTVRMLYPGASNVTKIQSVHAKWVLSDGRFMKDSKGRGIKDATKAAIDAFANR